MTAVSGYNDSEITLMKFFDLFSNEDTERVSKAVQETFPKDSSSIHAILVTKDRRQIPYEIKTSLLSDRTGNLIGISGVGRDLTERNKLETQLIQSQKMEAIGTLAGGVAHDFNNMLCVIIGHANLALMDLEPTQPIHVNIEEIRKAAERSAGLTKQLLAFARKQTIAPKVLNLNETITGMFNMLKRLIGEAIDLKLQPANDLWPVKVDPSQIDQILANLCVNARDAIADVGKITIETGNNIVDEGYCAHNPGFVQGEYVRLTVSDNGCGMDKTALAHIFEPFFTTKAVGAGTGLGLSTVYGAIKQNNGFINVYSEPGLGTTFTIYLPRYVGKDAQARPEAAGEPAQRGQETILLVEDEPSILNVATMLLTRQGYTVFAANTPNEAIHLAGEHVGEISLLMTDVVMPEMNGRDLARNLLSLNPNLKCLYMSGYSADVIAHHCVLDEGVHFIQKPFTMADLAAKVREVLDR
jgi:PAS domain S-box-containing protein